MPMLLHGTVATGHVTTAVALDTCTDNVCPRRATNAADNGLRSPIRAIIIARSVQGYSVQGIKLQAILEGHLLVDIKAQDL